MVWPNHDVTTMATMVFTDSRFLRSEPTVGLEGISVDLQQLFSSSGSSPSEGCDHSHGEPSSRTVPQNPRCELMLVRPQRRSPEN